MRGSGKTDGVGLEKEKNFFCLKRLNGFFGRFSFVFVLEFHVFFLKSKKVKLSLINREISRVVRFLYEKRFLEL